MTRDTIIADTTRRIFRDLCDPQYVNNAADESWKQPLWDALEESQLTVAWVPDTLGGAGAELADGFDVLHVAGSFAVPVALCDTLTAGWLLAQSGLSSPRGPMTCVPPSEGRIELRDGGLYGEVGAIPFAAEAGHLAGIAFQDDAPHAFLVAAGECQMDDAQSIAGDPLNQVRFEGTEPQQIAASNVDADALQTFGAVCRSVLMAGALEAVLDLAVTYAQDRVAFGRPIGKFQAVQHSLATLGCEAAAAAAAARSATDAVCQAGALDGDDVLLEVASAKIRSGEAAGAAAAIAHQVHGAIGFTHEHVLHRFTRRLWAWRDEYGAEAHWARRLGSRVAANGADALWPLVASR